VREQGTPRVSALAGPPASGRSLWLDWLALSGRAADPPAIRVEPDRAPRTWLEGAAAEAIQLVERAPVRPVAIAASAAAFSAWLGERRDRAAALIAEGLIDLAPDREAAPGASPAGDPAGTASTGTASGVGAAALSRARSLAELTLFEALAATRSTAGRFELNQLVGFHFGGRPAEVDLLSRGDRLAIEVDGPHHFADPDGYRRDRRKDLLLQAHGYAVVRFLAEDVLADPRAAVRAVCELLARRGGER
jgi:very-short-patch-repair endonuclease